MKADVKTIVIEAKPCPSCSKPMPGVLAGLCPACLLAQGAETDAGEAGRSTRFEAPPLAEVQRLFPRLEIVALLGAGGMGAVYKARQPALDRWVALKILPSENAGGVNFEERFNREARALARLNHPNIVTVHEFGKAGALHYFIMEFVDGANLRQLEQAGRLAPREALQIIPQICDALQYAHDEGVVHRDIKPENVLIDRKGRVKIADFGLAKIMSRNPEAQRLTVEGQVMGTPHYMAPEQVERPLAVDHRADIYALGVVFYEMLTGDLPLGKFSPPSRKVSVDVRLDEVVLRALENDPERRYQKASEVKSQVETIAGTPSPTAPVQTSSRPTARHARWMGFAVVVEKDGKRQVNWKEALKVFGILFAALTVAFLLVSLVTGRTFFGWLGISGGLSMLVRLLVSIAITAWGVWRAFRLPLEAPQTTAAFAPEGLSRKAVAGAIWAPFFVIATLLWFTSSLVVVHGDVTSRPNPSPEWWQILLSITVLPLGVSAPFATTILGWLAVGDIRRSHGRITGLPLAVFDGIFFPLLAFNGVLLWVWARSVRAVAEAMGNHGFTGPWPAIASIGSVVLCLVATFDISQRVWRAVRRDSSRKPSAARRIAFALLPGLVIIAGGIAAVVAVVKSGELQRRERLSSRHQVATPDAQSGRLVVRLPGGGTAELLGVGETNAALNGWWNFDGTPLGDVGYETPNAVQNSMSGLVSKDALFRVRDLPDGASFTGLYADPPSGSGSGHTVLRNGRPLSGAFQARFAWKPSVRKADLQMGFGLEPWRTIATISASGNTQNQKRLPDDPYWRVNFHHDPTDTSEGAQVALVFGPESRLWSHRLVAIDTNGVEHSANSSRGTPLETLTLWTYTFGRVPLKQAREFHVQVRPVHWVEFPNVALAPRAPLPPPHRPEFGPARELTLDGLIDFDTGVVTNFPAGRGGAKPFDHYPNLVWMRENKLDAGAALGELRTVDVDFVVLANEDWERMTAPEVMDQLHRSYFRPPYLKALTDGRLPATYAFRTREHGSGILQLVSFDEGKPGATIRYKLVQRDRTISKVQPAVSNREGPHLLRPEDPDAKSAFFGTLEQIKEPPQFRYLAWQDEWTKRETKRAWRPDGSLLSDSRELKILGRPSLLDVSATEAGKRNPRFLHLWFSHPLFSMRSLNAVTLLDTNGTPIKLAGASSMSSDVRDLEDGTNRTQMLTYTLAPGEGTNIPAMVTVRLRYAFGPLERVQEAASDFRGGLSLQGGSQLNGIGQDTDGRAFIALAISAGPRETRHFGVTAITRDGREVAPSGHNLNATHGAAFRVERFTFHTPLSDISRFRIGTRRIHEVEWPNVVLREPEVN